MDNALPRLAEHELRSALLELLAKRRQRHRIFEELHLENGLARIDVATVGSQLTGYEIKSDFDKPARFSNQIHAYNRAFDEIYLVVSSEAALRMVPLVPSWWGLYEGARDGKGRVKLNIVRPADPNPLRDPISVLSILRREELLGFAQQLDEPKRAARARRSALYELLADAFSLEQIARSVATALKARPTTPARETLVLGGD
jgi:hypothetical protein